MQYWQVAIKILPGVPHYWQYLVYIFRRLRILAACSKGPHNTGRGLGYWLQLGAPQYWQGPRLVAVVRGPAILAGTSGY